MIIRRTGFSRTFCLALLVILLVNTLLLIMRASNQNQADNDVMDPCVRESTRAQTDFVYVKMIKCASETLSSLFRRFGFHRNLTFVLPVGTRIYLGWPYQLQSDTYRHTDGSDYNILVDHAVYNKTTMKKIMKPGTVFITSIREPFQQFISTFHYYRLRNVTQMPGSIQGPITHYLHNLSLYEHKYSAQGTKHRRCVPDGLSMTKNLMAFNLGFPTGFPPGSPDLSHDSQFIDDWLKQIDEEFLLVMIVEYFDESLVLLKRLMCWSLKDILYHPRNRGNYTLSPTDQRYLTENQNIYKQWSNVDYRIYNYFQKVFWSKIQAQGPDFQAEVTYFQEINYKIREFCYLVLLLRPNSTETFTVAGSAWNPRFAYTTRDCHFHLDHLRKLLKQEFDLRFPHVTPPQPRSYIGTHHNRALC